MKTIKLLSMFLLFALIMVSCVSGQKTTQEQPDVNGLQTAVVETVIGSITQTAVAFPTTSTPIPYSELDLSPYLALPSNLPTGYIGGQLKPTHFEMFKDLPDTEYVISQDFQKDGNKAGGVNILVFSSPELAQQAFDKIQLGFGKDGEIAITEDGNIKLGVYVMVSPLQIVDMQVMRCNVIYFARFTDTTDSTSVAHYLSMLNQNTKNLIFCPKETLFPTLEPPTVTPTLLSQETLTFSGNGDSIVDINWGKAPGIVTIEANADGRFFSVISYDKDGNRLSSLVNTTDPYKGVRPLNFNGEDPVRLEVIAIGDWVLKILPLDQVESIAIPSTFNGTGDNVIALTGGIPDTATISGNSASRYFGIVAHNSNTERMSSLINTTDAYQGTVIMDKETAYLVIQAVGGWSISFVESK